jgi:hypothetical protein
VAKAHSGRWKQKQSELLRALKAIADGSNLRRKSLGNWEAGIAGEQKKTVWIPSSRTSKYADGHLPSSASGRIMLPGTATECFAFPKQKLASPNAKSFRVNKGRASHRLHQLTALFSSPLPQFSVHNGNSNYFVFLVAGYRGDSFNRWSAYGTGPPSIHLYSKWPDVATFLLIHVIVPLVYILVIVRYWCESKLHPEEPWDRLLLLSLAGLCLFLSVAHSAVWPRMYTVSLPALILMVWLLRAPFRAERFLLATAWTTAILLALTRPAITQTCWNEVLALPAGRTAFPGSPVAYEKSKWTLATHSTGRLFAGRSSFVLLATPARPEPSPVPATHVLYHARAG